MHLPAEAAHSFHTPCIAEASKENLNESPTLPANAAFPAEPQPVRRKVAYGPMKDMMIGGGSSEASPAGDH